MKTIVIGSGGREHAIACALAASPLVSEVICIPGNGGTATEGKCRNISIPTVELSSIVDACREELGSLDDGSFVLVGPEDPLAAGIANRLESAGLAVVGPKQNAAELEASKDTAKRFMSRYGVACAESETFRDAADAIAYIRQKTGPVVVKADGLAAGKGVVVASDQDTAVEAVRSFMIDMSLGGAGHKIVVEEYLEGEEISILAAVSVTPSISALGKARIVPFVTARDHKRLGDGAQGPNTGGMGAIAPVPNLPSEVIPRFTTEILEPTLKGLVAEGWDYRGFIFFGLMLTRDGPKLLEYNVRLGDPETQAVLPLMNFDFARMCRAMIDGELDSFTFDWKQGYVCAPVAVSGGYPGTYPKGIPIVFDRQIIEDAKAKVYIAGATVNHRNSRGDTGSTVHAPVSADEKGQELLITSGGRVLAVSAFGETLEQARDSAYNAIKGVTFDGMFYRRDIGLPGAAASSVM
ncbi:MAG: phosphoribosylamine--glycine ligase [Spirochaetales bacterium]|nr:phosphoribosylamine--glycine ligase [Spirochaetales bacterium]